MKKEQLEERDIMVLRKSRRSFLLEYGCALVLLILLALLRLKHVKISQSVVYLVLVLAFLFLASAEISRLAHRGKVTSSKLVIINGLIKQSKKHIYLGSISDIDVKQSFFQRIFNYGKIHIKSMSGEGSLEIKDIANPGEKMEEIEEIIEKYKNK